MPEWEYRFQELTLDGDKRQLSGIAMPYGSIASLPWGEELFEPRGFGPDVEQSVVFLDVMHVREKLLAKTGGGGLVLTDSPEALRLTATLPNTREADDTLELVSKGVLTGLSVAFRATKERQEGKRRVIQSAHLGRIAVVDVPAYADAMVSKRSQLDTQRRRRWL